MVNLTLKTELVIWDLRNSGQRDVERWRHGESVDVNHVDVIANPCTRQ